VFLLYKPRMPALWSPERGWGVSSTTRTAQSRACRRPSPSSPRTTPRRTRPSPASASPSASTAPTSRCCGRTRSWWRAGARCRCGTTCSPLAGRWTPRGDVGHGRGAQGRRGAARPVRQSAYQVEGGRVRQPQVLDAHQLPPPLLLPRERHRHGHRFTKMPLQVAVVELNILFVRICDELVLYSRPIRPFKFRLWTTRLIQTVICSGLEWHSLMGCSPSPWAMAARRCIDKTPGSKAGVSWTSPQTCWPWCPNVGGSQE
jgi:hypothetical protein